MIKRVAKLLGLFRSHRGEELLAPPYPSVLSVEITSQCNLKCKMCALTTAGTRSSQLVGHIDESVWRRILEVAGEVGFVNINGWGENFSNPRFLQYLRDLDDRNVSVNFSTNGTYITPAVVGELSALKHLTHVNVSIDSPDPGVYRKIRGLSLKPALRGLEALIQGLPRPERVTVSSVVMKENLQSLTEFPKLLATLGVRAYVLQGLVDAEDHYSSLFPGQGVSVSDVLARIGAECERLGISILAHPYLDHLVKGGEGSIWRELPEASRRDFETEAAPATRQCGSPWDHIFVNKDGLVLPCCNCPAWEPRAAGGHGIMGDLKERTFAQIWHGKPFRKFRAGLLGGEVPAICRTCKMVSMGPHFFRIYSARIIQGACRIDGHRIRLAVENTGLATWTGKTRLHLGTARPRDRPSRWHHPSWPSQNRVAALSEAQVEPGSRGSFHFSVSPEQATASRSCAERFQLVVEGVCWLPGTEVLLARERFADRLVQVYTQEDLWHTLRSSVDADDLA